MRPHNVPAILFCHLVPQSVKQDKHKRVLLDREDGLPPRLGFRRSLDSSSSSTTSGSSSSSSNNADRRSDGSSGTTNSNGFTGSTPVTVESLEILTPQKKASPPAPAAKASVLPYKKQGVAGSGGTGGITGGYPSADASWLPNVDISKVVADEISMVVFIVDMCGQGGGPAASRQVRRRVLMIRQDVLGRAQECGCGQGIRPAASSQVRRGERWYLLC